MSFYTGKNVLVTGGAGLVGHATIKRLLSEGAHVRATKFSSRDIKLTHQNLEIVQCDLMNMSECDAIVSDMDIVVNSVAAIRGIGGQIIEAASLVRNNIFPMINIIVAAAQAQVDRFIFIGSSAMYPPVDYPVTEDEGFIGDPFPVYYGMGWVKRYSEKMCMHYHTVTKTKFAITRTTAVYGPYDNFLPNRSHVIPDLIKKAEKRENPFYVWGDGSQIRDFIYVDDFVDGMLKIGERHANATPVNIASGREVSVKMLVETILEQSGYLPTVQYDQSKPIAIPYRMVSIERAKKLISWEAKTFLSDGIKKTIDWYRKDFCV